MKWGRYLSQINMIYKFVDINDSEISVNSISSLQALVDSDTIKENTKIKAGLRGEWTTASKIVELSFAKEVEEVISETIIPETDIKPSIKLEKETDEDTPQKKIDEVSIQPWQTKKEKSEKIKNQNLEDLNFKIENEEWIESKSGASIDDKEEIIEVVEKPDDVIEENIDIDNSDEKEKSEYELKKEKEEEERDKTYDDENVIGLNFFDSIKICFKKYFVVDGRASRSEYWWFFLFSIIIDITSEALDYSMGFKSDEYGMFFFISLITVIPMITVTARRLHDMNKSGWWMLISLTIIGAIPLLIWTIKKGTDGKNRFGEYPLSLK